MGDIVRQYGVRIDPNETAVALTDRLAELGAGLLIECIRDLPRSVQYSIPQSNENASYGILFMNSPCFLSNICTYIIIFIFSEKNYTVYCSCQLE